MSENLITKTTVWAMEIVSQYVKPGDTVIDGTMGNGHDTLALAKLVGPEGSVIAFDIQPQALENTKALLCQEGITVAVGADTEASVHLILDSNANLRNYVGEVAAVLFNLGYLPGGDKSITTNKDETLKAVSGALDMVKPGGLVCAVLYSGHQQGFDEKAALLEWAKELPGKEYHVAYISMWNQKKCPPELLLITKK